MHPSIDFLRRFAFRNHKVVWDKMGPSHGDPGGYQFVVTSRSCKSVIEGPMGTSVTGYDDLKCNCGALEHNRKVFAAAAELDNLIP